MINRFGKVVLLKEGNLAKKFKDVYTSKILTAYVDRKTSRDQLERETLKKGNLNTLNAGGAGRRTDVPVEDVAKIHDPDKIKKILSDIEAKY